MYVEGFQEEGLISDGTNAPRPQPGAVVDHHEHHVLSGVTAGEFGALGLDERPL